MASNYLKSSLSTAQNDKMHYRFIPYDTRNINSELEDDSIKITTLKFKETYERQTKE